MVRACTNLFDSPVAITAFLCGFMRVHLEVTVNVFFKKGQNLNVLARTCVFVGGTTGSPQGLNYDSNETVNKSTKETF